ncbi:hypothetical protein MtrunA17_Chr5g0427391 [Medicago truncatula]|uniref:Uncharacterized protein n=1 Tax=Medicago truncatula TaxID=3880 RepID=A0A396HZV1_MEDTR|nr:hypothetical protein MtrunA17_Chr5g0427391 [Medicago truncatula]
MPIITRQIPPSTPYKKTTYTDALSGFSTIRKISMIELLAYSNSNSTREP